MGIRVWMIDVFHIIVDILRHIRQVMTENENLFLAMVKNIEILVETHLLEVMVEICYLAMVKNFGMVPKTHLLGVMVGILHRMREVVIKEENYYLAVVKDLGMLLEALLLQVVVGICLLYTSPSPRDA